MVVKKWAPDLQCKDDLQDAPWVALGKELTTRGPVGYSSADTIYNRATARMKNSSTATFGYAGRSGMMYCLVSPFVKLYFGIGA